MRFPTSPSNFLAMNPPLRAVRPRRVTASAIILGLLFLALASASCWAQGSYDYRAARKAMVENEIIAAGVQDPRVIEALLATDRHEFVPRKLRRMAYFDMALPIGDRQTISSPFIVSFMTELLDPQPTDRVLEIGTGSGFQAAILSPLVKDVYTIEIVEALGKTAEQVLNRLEYKNVHVRVGDGFLGWPENAPFDKIIVTCSPEKVPQPLKEQLREGGRMVIPVGERYQQTLYLFTKKNGELEKEAVRPTLFVPMTGEAEDSREVKPDPTKPRIINGDFETPSEDDSLVPGWYYGRQLELDIQPDGTQSVLFTNRERGRSSHLLQGFALDGRKVSRLEIATRVRTFDVQPLQNGRAAAMVITFYDHERGEVGSNWVGPWRGTNGWQAAKKIVRVPKTAREAIVRIGLLGATGSAAFDDVSVSVPEG